MANTNKMTIADKFNAIVKALNDNDIVLDLDGQTVDEFLADRIEKAKKKSSGVKVIDPEKQKVRDEILTVLANASNPMSISEMQGASTLLNSKSTSCITQNMRTMLINGKVPNEDGCIMRVMEGKTAKFRIG